MSNLLFMGNLGSGEMVIILLLIGLIIFSVVKSNESKPKEKNFLRQQTNVYVELRQWKLWWGLTFDSEVAINEVLNEWNNKGYTCIAYHLGFMPKLGLITMLGVCLISILTLGFMQLWVGPSFLFVRADKNINSLPDENKDNILS